MLSWPENTDRIILDEVDSTMSEAARLAPDLKRPTWIMAYHQTAARGRRGKTWVHPTGNFAATFVFRPEGTAAEAALRSFSAANALFEALALFADRDHLAQKWPNDVLLNGGKVAGILLESSGTQTGIDWLSIGFGVNLTHAPEAVKDAAFTPVCLADMKVGVPDAHELLALLALNMATEERLFRAMGFASIRNRWLRQAAKLGDNITARTATGEITGRFETIDDAGQLVLSTPNGQVAIPAGDVFF